MGFNGGTVKRWPMTRIVPAIFILIGALLLAPLIYGAVLVVSGSSVTLNNAGGLLVFVIIPVSGLALIWTGFRGPRPRRKAPPPALEE